MKEVYIILFGLVSMAINIALLIVLATFSPSRTQYGDYMYKAGVNDMACLVGVKEKCPTKEQLMERMKK